MKTTYSSLNELQAAVDSGSTVYWQNESYTVVPNLLTGERLIRHINGSCVGLTNKSGELIENLRDFYSIAKTLDEYCPISTNGNRQTLFIPITAEYRGKRYFITSTPNVCDAETIALDFVAEFPGARFLTGAKWGSDVVNGNARSFRAHYAAFLKQTLANMEVAKRGREQYKNWKS
jgi:hypothetical protein